jgi:hypothetical protein
MVDFGWAGPQDARQYELKQQKIWQVAGFPTAIPALKGVVAYNTVTDRFAVCTGSTWVLLATDSDNLGGSPKSFFQDLANIPNGNLATTRITGFDTQVRTSRLDQMAAPTAPVNLNSQRITSLQVSSTTTDAVRRSELDAVRTIAENAAVGVAYKSPVRVVATAPLTLTAPGGTIDNVTMSPNDRVLVAGQAGDINTAHLDNGIYVFNGAAAALSRAADANETGELAPGTQVVVTEGTSPNADRTWYLVTDVAITVGTTAQRWSKLPAAIAELMQAGLGLALTGNTLDIGAGVGVEIGADTVSVKRGAADGTRVPLMKEITITGAVSGTVDLAHGLGYQYPDTTIWENQAGTWAEVGGVGKEPYSTTNMRLFFGTTPTDGQYKVVFHG